MNRLQERYQETVVPTLTKEFGYANAMAVPKIQRVVVNMGIGRCHTERQADRYRER